MHALCQYAVSINFFATSRIENRPSLSNLLQLLAILAIQRRSDRVIRYQPTRCGGLPFRPFSTGKISPACVTLDSAAFPAACREQEDQGAE